MNELPWDVINMLTRQVGMDRYLVGAIILQESGGDPYAVRYEPDFKYRVNTSKFAKLCKISQETESLLQACSIGLMQTMGCVARELGFGRNLLELTKPDYSILIGCKKLAKLSATYEDLNEMIASYNSGSPRYDEKGVLKNHKYVEGVLWRMEKLREKL